MHDRLYSFLEKKESLYEHQFGLEITALLQMH